MSRQYPNAGAATKREAAWVGNGSRNVEEEEEAAGAGTRLRRRRARELFISSDDTQMAVLRVSSIFWVL